MSRAWVVGVSLALAGMACGSGTGGPSDGETDGDGPSDPGADAETADSDTSPADVESGADADADADADVETDVPYPPPAENWQRDILHIGLAVDVSTRTGTATIVLGPSPEPGVSFAVQGLDIASVVGPAGPLEFTVGAGRLDVGVPAAPGLTITVDYAFGIQVDFEGYSRRGWTLTWPDHCGNLFPCHAWPAEGQTFELTVDGVPDGSTAVHPAALETDAPAYQIAWATDAFVSQAIGTTAAGTRIEAWTVAGSAGDAATGMADVPAVFDWYERTLGPYPFGERAGAVGVRWPPTAYGGMEHHPLWHVAEPALGDRWVHVHEAAHGWFGDGVRIVRWEDLVLSEGTACYLAARALGQAVGVDAEAEAWTDYDAELDTIVARTDRLAWPDPIADPAELEDFLFSRAPYMKGAFFFRAVATAVGAEELDRVLGLFFAEHVGQAAGMQDLLDLIEVETGFDPTILAAGWLRSLGRPDR